MLGMKTYNKNYIDACRARFDAGLRAYRKQAGKAPSREFEYRFFNGQVLLLDSMFVHWFTGIEGKDRRITDLATRLLPTAVDFWHSRTTNW